MAQNALDELLPAGAFHETGTDICRRILVFPWRRSVHGYHSINSDRKRTTWEPSGAGVLSVQASPGNPDPDSSRSLHAHFWSDVQCHKPRFGLPQPIRL